MISLGKLLFPGPDRFRCAMASMGGVGSTALARHLGSFADKTDREHAYSPAVYDSYANLRLGYMFGNPYNSVLSIFSRGYQQMHAGRMHAHSDTTPAHLHGMSLHEYLERGVDEFFMERQFNNWTNPACTRHPTLLIRYELLDRHIEQILDFFACRKTFHIQARKTCWRDQPEHVRRGLEKIYGALNDRIEGMPGIVPMLPDQQQWHTFGAAR